ncbi:MAG: AbrB/MazE/SpoVT family DNA-binding domain-containing protein [Methylobacter sp.]
MNQQAAKISAGGRIVLPAQMRASLGIHEGDELLISVVNGEIHITPKALALQNALAIARKHLVGSPDLSNALIADRRAEAANE